MWFWFVIFNPWTCNHKDRPVTIQVSHVQSECKNRERGRLFGTNFFYLKSHMTRFCINGLDFLEKIKPPKPNKKSRLNLLIPSSWVVVSNYWLFLPRFVGKWNPIWLAHIFQMGWRKTHQLVNSQILVMFCVTFHGEDEQTFWYLGCKWKLVSS